MIISAAVAVAAGALVIGLWLHETRQPPETTENTWWRVVAMHIEDATPKRRM